MKPLTPIPVASSLPMLKSYASLLCLVLSCAAARSVQAAEIVPPTPIAGQTLMVSEQTTSNTCRDEVKIKSIVRAGSEITITYSVQPITPGACLGLPPVLFLNAYIGTFPPGIYTVRTNGDYHGTLPTRNSMQFSVALAPSAAVEYYSPARDHYFVTDFADEIGLLDSGYISGWQRTGEEFGTFPMNEATVVDLATGMTPVCRFYGRPQAGLDSHFFSASPNECESVIQKFAASWLLETTRAFGSILPDINSGACPTGAVAIYRVYNNRSDANHRYMTSVTIRNSMVSSGWIPEGYGPQSVAMCAPVQR